MEPTTSLHVLISYGACASVQPTPGPIFVLVPPDRLTLHIVSALTLARFSEQDYFASTASRPLLGLFSLSTCSPRWDYYFRRATPWSSWDLHPTVATYRLNKLADRRYTTSSTYLHPLFVTFAFNFLSPVTRCNYDRSESDSAQLVGLLFHPSLLFLMRHHWPYNPSIDCRGSQSTRRL